MTKRQRDGYRARRVYFWALARSSVSAWGRHFLFTSFQVAYHGALLTLFISPMKEAGELCLSSDMFCTCYAHSNRQISLIRIKQQLVLREDVSLFASLLPKTITLQRRRRKEGGSDSSRSFLKAFFFVLSDSSSITLQGSWSLKSYISILKSSSLEHF